MAKQKEAESPNQNELNETGNIQAQNGNFDAKNETSQSPFVISPLDKELLKVEVIIIGLEANGVIPTRVEVDSSIEVVGDKVFAIVRAEDIPKGSLEEFSISELHKLYGLCNKSIIQLNPSDEGFAETMELMTKLRMKVESFTPFDPLESFKQAYPNEAKMLNRKTPVEKAKERLEAQAKEEAEKVAEIAKKKAEAEKEKSGEEDEGTEESKE